MNFRTPFDVINKPLPLICFYTLLPHMAMQYQYQPYHMQYHYAQTPQNVIVIDDDEVPQSIQNLALNQFQSGEHHAVATSEPVHEPIPISPQGFDEYSPYIKISVYKQHQNQSSKPFILQNDRIVGCCSENIVIGRKKQTDDNSYVTDIPLPHGDKNVDKAHCRIDTQKGFKYSSKLGLDLVLFLSLRKTSLVNMPFGVLSKIVSFVKSLPEFYITDMGTQLSSYVRVRKDKPRVISLESTYLIGADTQFHVMGMNQAQKLKKPKDYEYFMQALVRESLRDIKIHGLSTEESELLQLKIEEFRTSKVRGRKQFKLSNCDRPYMKIEFNQAPMHQSSVHIFICQPNDNKVFRIGRSQDCDVIIPINTVSRKQATIYFNNNQWSIMDGEQERESANGTWQSFQNYLQRRLDIKHESEPKLIEDQMEVKISENILKFDFVNFGARKKRRLNSEVLNHLLHL